MVNLSRVLAPPKQIAPFLPQPHQEATPEAKTIRQAVISKEIVLSGANVVGYVMNDAAGQLTGGHSVVAAAHAASHENGGADEISVAGLSGELADAQTPKAHKTSHENGGADEISVAGLSGELADAQTPKAHKTSHENGGADEISVAGLSGVLADAQTPAAHNTSHEDGGADEINTLNPINVKSDGVSLTGLNGTLTFKGLGDGADEDLKFDFNTTANTVIVSTSTGVEKIDFSAISLKTTGTVTCDKVINSGDAECMINMNAAEDTFYFRPGYSLGDNYVVFYSSSDDSANPVIRSNANNEGTLGTSSYYWNNTYTTTLTTSNITIGANTLTTTEWAYLDGQDQAVKTTSSPTFNTPSVTKLVVTGANGVTRNTYHLQFSGVKTGITDATATDIFQVATTNEASNDGGGWTVFVRAMAGHSVANNSSYVATWNHAWSSTHATNAGGSSGVTTSPTEFVAGAAAATASATRSIADCTATVVYVSNYTAKYQINIDLTGTDVQTGQYIYFVDLIYYGYTTPPVISAL